MLKDNYNIEFKNNISGFISEAEKIVITNSETERFDNVVNILVSDNESNIPVYNFEVRCEIPGSFFKGETIFSEYVTFAVENFVYLFKLSTKQTFMHKLHGYFDNFYQTNNHLIIGTDTHLTCINVNGNVKWVSDKLGVEKTAIKEVVENQIIGSGNWGDSKGWHTFSISLENGKNTNAKKSPEGMFGFFRKLINQAAFVLS